MLLGLPALFMAASLQAQAVIDNSPPPRHFTEQEIADVPMPELAFDETADDTKDYDKYFYFHRDGTGFDEAYADIIECDALASGFTYYGGASPYMTNYYAIQYGLGGVIGGAIGSALADAIYGSAERRKERRFNLRNCMYFKGYDRFGLRKSLWEEFNFEEGNSKEEPEKRARKLLMQAKVASGPRPQQEVLKP